MEVAARGRQQPEMAEREAVAIDVQSARAREVRLGSLISSGDTLERKTPGTGSHKVTALH